MRRITVIALVGLLCALASSAWALSPDDQQGCAKLLSDTVASLSKGEPALWSLFSTQGSAAVIQTGQTFAAANRGDLKKEAVGANFRLPGGVVLGDDSLARTGTFIMGRVILVGKPVAHWIPEGPPLKDLWTAFMHPDSEFKVVRPGPGQKPAAAPAGPPLQKWEMTATALQDGPENSWRWVTLVITPVMSEPDQVVSGAVVDNLRSWEGALLKGDMSVLAKQLNPDPFCVAAQTPDGQSWFFTYPEYLTTMLGSALSMGTAEKSEMLGLTVSASGPVATTTGKWAVTIPMFGAMTWGLTATLVKPADRWMLVSLCAGMLEQ